MQNGVKFAYVDITENMAALKAFIKYRENSPEFDGVKQRNGLGVPCVVVNDGEKIIVDNPDALKELR